MTNVKSPFERQKEYVDRLKTRNNLQERRSCDEQLVIALSEAMVKGTSFFVVNEDERVVHEATIYNMECIGGGDFEITVRSKGGKCFYCDYKFESMYCELQLFHSLEEAYRAAVLEYDIFCAIDKETTLYCKEYFANDPEVMEKVTEYEEEQLQDQPDLQRIY